MIAGLLHGRIHLNMQEFRQQNHMTFFSNVLTILELLQPLVFHSNHQRALQDCLLSFMKVLQVLTRLALTSMLNKPQIKVWLDCLATFYFVELSEESLSAGLHEQVPALYTELHNARRSSSRSFSTEPFRRFTVSQSCALWIQLDVNTA